LAKTAKTFHGCFGWNTTVSKLFWNCFVSVLFQFHFSCADSFTKLFLPTYAAAKLKHLRVPDKKLSRGHDFSFAVSLDSTVCTEMYHLK